MTDKYFIDASSIADWLLIRMIFDEERLTNEERIKSLNEHKDKNKNAYYSYLLIETLGANDKIKGVSFYTSPLALTEVVSVITKESRLKETHKMHIPLIYALKQKPIVDVKPDDISNIAHNIIQFYLRFVKNKKIGFIHNSALQVSMGLITKNRCQCHDAFLLSQAYSKRCGFFVTSEERLKNQDPKIKLINIVSPQKAYEDIKHLSKNKKITFPIN